VRVEITLVRVGIKFVPVEITLHVEIMVSVILTRIRVKLILVCVESTLRMEILLC
jgi:hypothetical protein